MLDLIIRKLDSMGYQAIVTDGQSNTIWSRSFTDSDELHNTVAAMKDMPSETVATLDKRFIEDAQGGYMQLARIYEVAFEDFKALGFTEYRSTWK